MRLIGRVFSASLLDLSLKKYIEFEKDAKNNITIRILKNQTKELEKSETRVLEFLINPAENKDTITVKELQKYMKKTRN